MTENINEYIEKIENLMPIFASNFHEDSPASIVGFDITIVQICTLNVLYKNDNCKMSDLSASLCVTLGNMTSMVDRLIKHGLVVRVADPEDRRVVRVRLTPKGKRTMNTIVDRRRENAARILKKLSTSDISELIKILEKIANVIKTDRERGKQQ